MVIIIGRVGIIPARVASRRRAASARSRQVPAGAFARTGDADLVADSVAGGALEPAAALTSVAAFHERTIGELAGMHVAHEGLGPHLDGHLNGPDELRAWHWALERARGARQPRQLAGGCGT